MFIIMNNVYLHLCSPPMKCPKFLWSVQHMYQFWFAFCKLACFTHGTWRDLTYAEILYTLQQCQTPWSHNTCVHVYCTLTACHWHIILITKTPVPRVGLKRALQYHQKVTSGAVHAVQRNMVVVSPKPVVIIIKINYNFNEKLLSMASKYNSRSFSPG